MLSMSLVNKILLNNKEYHKKYSKENKTEDHEKEELKMLCNILPNLLVEKNIDLAIDVLQEHCRLYSRDAKAYIFLGRLYELKNEYNVSLYFYKLAVFLKPESYNFLKMMKSALLRFLKKHQVSLSLKIQCYSYDIFYKNLFSEKMNSLELESLLLQSELNILLDTIEKSKNSNSILNNNLKNEKCLWEEEEIFPYYRYSKEIIKAGEILSYERPYAVAPILPLETYKTFTICFHCLRECSIRKTIFTCPLYPKTCPFLFCSSECVLQNSIIHQQECQFITRIVFPLSKKTGFSSSFILLVLRILIRAYNEECIEPYKKSNIRFFFQSSFSYYTTYQNNHENRFWIHSCLNDFVDDLFLLFPIEFLLGFNKKEMKYIISLIHTFCISVTCDSLYRYGKHIKLGLIFSLEICHFQHSCLPNCCSIYTKDGILIIRSLETIHFGNQLTISYLDDLMLPTNQRKQLDSSLNILSCQCERCISIDEKQRYIRGQRCSLCIQGICNPSNYLFSDYLYYLKKPTGFFFKKIQEMKQSFLDYLINNSYYKTLENNKKNDILNHYFIWTCSKCGPLSLYDSQRCYELEKQAEDLLYKIKENYSLGERVMTLKLCDIFFSKYDIYFHNNHYISYHVHLYSVGIFQYYKKYHQAFYHIICALHIAHHILPIFHYEKIHLYKVYSDLLLTCNSSLTSYDALWIAVVNAWFTCSPKSSQWIEALLCLRSIAKQINHHTPPMIKQPQLIQINYPIHYFLYKNFHIDNQENLKQIIEKDYQSIIYRILLTKNIHLLQKLFSSSLFLRRELECPNMITGLTALGFATSLSDPSLVQFLLSYNVNCFSENELNMTPLLSMASQPYKSKNIDENQAKICSLLCRHIENIQISLIKKNKVYCSYNHSFQFFHTNGLKNQFLYARVHDVLGKNTAAHYAAAYGKEHLLFQLFHEGLSMEINNAEYATPLHLACMNGHHIIVERMLKNQCCVDPYNIWGITPLLLACYNLHVQVIQILIHFKANILYQTSQTKLSCLHALVLGLTKSLTFSTNFNSIDQPNFHQFNYELSSSEIFTTNIHPFHEIQSFKSFISFSKKDNEQLFVFPDILQTRLEKTYCILQLLANIIPTPRVLLNTRLTIGLTPFELLQSRVKILFKLHQHAWSHTTLRFTTTKRSEMREAWKIIFFQFDDLIEKLRPSKIKKKSS
jgi:ankyrin repeat protein